MIQPTSVCIASIMRLTYIWIPSQPDQRKTFPLVLTSFSANILPDSGPPLSDALVNHSTGNCHTLQLPTHLRTLTQESQTRYPQHYDLLPKLLWKEQQRNPGLYNKRHYNREFILLQKSGEDRCQ